MQKKTDWEVGQGLSPLPYNLQAPALYHPSPKHWSEVKYKDEFGNIPHWIWGRRFLGMGVTVLWITVLYHEPGELATPANGPDLSARIHFWAALHEQFSVRYNSRHPSA